MNKKETIVYIAGIIDGEAYIGIKKSTWGLRNRPDIHCPTYSERIQIRMACNKILQLIKDNFGGSLSREPRVYQSKSGFKTRKIMNIYRATDKVAANIIIAVKPFLIEKRKQAINILKLRKNKESRQANFRGSPKRRLMSDKVIDYREKLYQEIRNIHNPN